MTDQLEQLIATFLEGFDWRVHRHADYASYAREFLSTLEREIGAFPLTSKTVNTTFNRKEYQREYMRDYMRSYRRRQKPKRKKRDKP